MAAECSCCPGDRLGAAEGYSAGPGTYEKDGFIYASVMGVQHVSSPAGQKPTIQVVSKQAPPALPDTGNIVTAKVTKVVPTAARLKILCLGDKPLDVDFTGVIRQRDVRATEIDKVVMYDCFRPGDIVRCEVLSLGDARSYYLTTARNELGVVYSKGSAGVPMTPISWQEMQCPQTLEVQRRKVAKAV